MNLLANPPFNEADAFRNDDDVRWHGAGAEKDQLQIDPQGAARQRRQFSVLPKSNANFAWVQLFIHHPAPHGMAGFVLANGSLSSKQSGEGDIRRKLLEADLEDCMVALYGRPFFSTQIPVCLWFFEKLETRRLNVRHSKLISFGITLLWPRHFQTSN
jgi:type I restriction enzyme M protein